MKGRIKKIAGGLFRLFMWVLAANVLFYIMAELTIDRTAHFTPSYAQVDLSETLGKEVWSAEDYSLLYRQTGLTEAGLRNIAREDIPAFQQAFFGTYEIRHEAASPITPHDALYTRNEGGESVPAYVLIAPLEEGDVLVTSSCHTFGWRNGHAAIVVDVEAELTLESIGPGHDSGTGLLEWFRHASNFMVLRLKNATREERKAIAEDACRYLTGVPYSIFTGFFSQKDQGRSPKTTHCSHLIWQAFRNFGYELDGDGGPVCTARDIANCGAFELIQVFGFDPDRLWN